MVQGNTRDEKENQVKQKRIKKVLIFEKKWL